MIQLEKMVKDPPTDDSAYYDIAETLGAFEENYKYFKDKNIHDIGGILENVENATREEALVAFGTLVAWEHLNEGLIQNVKEQGFLSKLLKRIIETNKTADLELGEGELAVEDEESTEDEPDSDIDDFEYFLEPGETGEGEPDSDMDDFDYFLEPKKTEKSDAEDIPDDEDTDDFEYFQEPKKEESAMDDMKFEDFVMQTIKEDHKDPEIAEMIRFEINRSEEELKNSKQMRDLLKDYEAHEAGIGFDLDIVKQTLDPTVIHATVLRVMTEQGVPGWAKRFYIKGHLMELAKMNCE